MSKYTVKLSKLASELLAPGEELLVGIRAKPAWTIGAAMAGAASGAASGAVAGATGSPVSGVNSGSGSPRQREEEAARLASFPYPSSMAIGLTSERLLVWKRSLLFGYLQEYQGDFPLGEIESVKKFNERGLGDRILIKLKTGHTIRIYGVRKDGTKEFVDHLKSM